MALFGSRSWQDQPQPSSSSPSQSRRNDKDTAVGETPILLHAALGLLTLTALVELALISATVSWLHRTAHGTLSILDNNSSSSSSSSSSNNNSTFELAWKPRILLLDQGHTANGAAGTALILVGLVGFLALWLRGRPDAPSSRIAAVLSPVWAALTTLSCVFSAAALAYVLTVTQAHAGQAIDVSVARALNGGNTNNDNNSHIMNSSSSSSSIKYPLGTWTPQGWFSAVLRLDVADESVRDDIARHLEIMRGWQYNLVVLFVVGVATAGLVLLDASRRRRQRPETTEYSNVEQKPSAVLP